MDTEFLDRFGYYVVCGQKYYNKLEAFNVAFSQGYHPHWYFHEHVFDAMDWKTEPNKSLQQLYKERAQSLRDKYDIIVLNFSGGADSSTVAEIFLHNGIKLDYLFCRSAIESLSRRDYGKDEANRYAEILHAAWPLYKEYKKIQPDLEFVAWNYPKQAADFWTDVGELDPYTTNNYAPDLGLKVNINQYFKDKFGDKKVCYLHSIDKPFLFFKDNTFQMYFMDQSFLQQIPSTQIFLNNGINMETFFWTPDAKEILCKQAHIVKKYFKAHPDKMHLINNFPVRCNADIWKRLMNGLVYDAAKNNLWQVEKADRRWQLTSYSFLTEADSVSTEIYKKFYASYESEVLKIFQDRDTKFMYKGSLFDGLPSCFSKMYDIGV